jgi:hypothetical protein
MYKYFHKGLSAIADVLEIDIIPLTRKWQDIYLKRLKHRGKKDAVKFMKELCTVAERYALHQPIEPLPWTKSSSDGFPHCLNIFKTYLRSEDHKQIIMALSVMRSCECLRLPISKDLDSVTEPPVGVDHTVLEGITSYIPEFVSGIKSINIPEMEYHLTVKNGPRGHALWTSDEDIRSIMREPHLYKAIRTIEDKLNDRQPMEIPPDGEIPDGKYIHSKITQFPEKSGKTRTIAIIDYYSQRSLKPLHKGLMDILESLESDGTSSHANVGKYAERKCKERSYIYCADLSSATDRFPKQIQEALLHGLIKDSDLAAAFYTLLTDRKFTVAWSGETVTYNCGQPMGCYSSWPLFSLAHHLVVEYCAKCAGIPSRKAKYLYKIIGDDVIITEEKIAQYYKHVMPALGMTINVGKTVESLPSHPLGCAEVAKQFYTHKYCITPLTPGFVKDLRKSYMFNTCIKVLNDRYDFISSEVPSMLINALYPKGKLRERVWLYCSNPMDGFVKPGFPGYDEYSPWVGMNIDKVLGVYQERIIEYLMNTTVLYANSINYELRGPGGPWKDRSCSPPKALDHVTNSIMTRLYRITMSFSSLLEKADLDKILEEIAYIPDPVQPYRSRRELKSKRQSTLYIQVYNEVKMWEREETISNI